MKELKELARDELFWEEKEQRAESEQMSER